LAGFENFNLQNFIRNDLIGDYGLFDLFIPLFLIYIIFYTLLTFIEIPKVTEGDLSGKNAKKFRTVVSLCFALLLVIPHVIWGNNANTVASVEFQTGFLAGFPDVVSVVYLFLPQVSLVLIMSVLALIAIQSATSGNNNNVVKTIMDSPWYAGFIALTLTYIFYTSVIGKTVDSSKYLTQEFIGGILFLAFIGWMFYLMFFDGETNTPPTATTPPAGAPGGNV
jgi:hypothetical protein